MGASDRIGTSTGKVETMVRTAKQVCLPLGD